MIECTASQGVAVGGILDTIYLTRDPPEGAIFFKSRPPYAIIDVRHDAFLIILFVFFQVLAIFLTLISACR